MARSDADIVRTHKAKRAAAKTWLATWRARAAFWRTAKRRLKPGTKAYKHAAGRLAARERKVGDWKRKVAAESRIIARHSPLPTLPGSHASTEYVTMYDSVNVSAIPSGAKYVAGYIGGAWPTYEKLKGRHPHVLSIAVASRFNADCLDVEPGDAWPVTNPVIPAWIRRQHARGKAKPIVYTSASAANSLVGALRRAGIADTSWELWTAHYTGRPHICSSACGYPQSKTPAATQYTDTALGRNLDASHAAKRLFG